MRVFILCLFLALMPLTMGFYSPLLVTLPENKKAEFIFMNAPMARNLTLPALWGTTIVAKTIGSDGSYMNVYNFGKGDYFLERKHIPHGVDFSKALSDMDLHHCITSSTAGIIKCQASFYHIYPGRVFGALEPDLVVNFDVTVLAGDSINTERIQFSHNSADFSSWQPNRSLHDEILVRFERLSTGDTYSGDLQVLHGELHNWEDGSFHRGQ